jgi:hypothetical protein
VVGGSGSIRATAAIGTKGAIGSETLVGREGLPYLTNAPGTYASKPELEARRGLQQGIQTKSQTCPNGTIDNKMDADGCGHAIGVVCRVGGDQGRSPLA